VMAENDDARDERIARLLEVEPLDEVTRRRLVSTAVRASAPPMRRSGTEPARVSRRLVAAAAIVGVAVVAGLGYLVSRDGDSTSPTASRDQSAPTAPAEAATGSATGASSAAPNAAPESLNQKSQQGSFDATAVPAPRDAGDFGDLRTAENLDRLRSALAGSETASTVEGTPPSDRVTSLLAQLGEKACASELPAGTVIAVGTGRFGTRDAIVVQTELADGTRSVDAVVADPCTVRPLD
jgi:hypothetical protein